MKNQNILHWKNETRSIGRRPSIFLPPDLPHAEEPPLYRQEESRWGALRFFMPVLVGFFIILHTSERSFRMMKNSLYTGMKNPQNNDLRFFMPVLVGFFIILHAPESSFRMMKNSLYTGMKNPKNKESRFFMPVLVGFFIILHPRDFRRSASWRIAFIQTWRILRTNNGDSSCRC